MWHTPAVIALSEISDVHRLLKINRKEITGFSLYAKPLTLLCCHEICPSDSSVTGCLV